MKRFPIALAYLVVYRPCPQGNAGCVPARCFGRRHEPCDGPRRITCGRFRPDEPWLSADPETCRAGIAAQHDRYRWF